MLAKLRTALGICVHDFDRDECAHHVEEDGSHGTMIGPLHCSRTLGADHYLELTDREHWTSWALKSWRWALDTGAEWFLSLQDDVEIAPQFWPALRAMMTAWPHEVISLAATHSMAREVARQGRRSYRTPHIIGWGWATPALILRDLVACADSGALDKFHAEHPTDGEDTFVECFLADQHVVPRSPVPTIVDHLHVASTNEGFDNHTHRRSVVTWRGYEPGDMAEPLWWQSTCSALPADIWRLCWLCQKNEAHRRWESGVEICDQCLRDIALTEFPRLF